ncbi:MAG: phosphoheptose isomerase [Balneolaceae bacterium]|nr:phosphoheptose isomerase [Balneolaceae bacterium]MDR9446818.1 phosphoheptose isomerase [Balneolaceae bacterium]
MAKKSAKEKMTHQSSPAKVPLFETSEVARLSKEEMFEALVERVTDLGFTLIGEDRHRPWGGFLLVDESQARIFATSWFPELDWQHLKGYSKLSPKFLLVEPHAMLSWQYHHRRSEIWTLIAGEASLVRSHTDSLGAPSPLRLGEMVELACKERHRLLGDEQWGIVAEIWKHELPQHPSDEDDIIRVEDAYGR